MIDPNGRQIDYQYNSALDSAISRPDAVADDSAPTLPLATTCANSLIEQDTATAVDSGGVLPTSHFLQYALDPSFNDTGELVTANSGSYDSVAIQNNGESIVAGVTGSNLTITRYAVSGTLDPTFGTAGVVTISESSPTFAKLAMDSSGNIDVAVNSGSNVKVYQLSGSGSTNWSKTLTFATGVVPQGIALEPSGDIIVAGDSSGGAGIYLAGLNPSTGAIDTGFGSSGYVNAPLSGNPSGLSVALDSSGKILVAGSDSGDFSVVRFTSSGSPDTSFNSTDEVTVNLGGTDTAYAVAPDPAGTIVAAGVSVQSGNNDDALIRLTSSGALDTSFNSTGKIVGSSGSGTIRAILVQTNGEVSGLWLNAYQARGGPEMAHLLRCRSSTTLPAESLRRSASHLGHFRPATTLKRLEPEPAGGDASSGTAQKVWMFTPAGAADTAFASGGTLTANSGATVFGWAVASGPTQRIVVAGSYGGDEALAAFAPASVRLYAQQDANYDVTAMVDSNGNVVQRYVYDSYGNMTVLSAAWTPQSDLFNTQVGFQGMWLDAASGLYHTPSRDYSSALGRWMEQDPDGYVNGANVYQMELSGPTSSLDPTGLAARAAQPAPFSGNAKQQDLPGQNGLWQARFQKMTDPDPAHGGALGLGMEIKYFPNTDVSHCDMIDILQFTQVLDAANGNAITPITDLDGHDLELTNAAGWGIDSQSPISPYYTESVAGRSHPYIRNVPGDVGKFALLSDFPHPLEWPRDSIYAFVDVAQITAGKGKGFVLDAVMWAFETSANGVVPYSKSTSTDPLFTVNGWSQDIGDAINIWQAKYPLATIVPFTWNNKPN